MGMNGINSLSHTKWNCKYHIVLAPKLKEDELGDQMKILGTSPFMGSK